MAGDVAVFVGSLQRESFNRLVPEPFRTANVAIGELPVDNQDDDGNPPACVGSYSGDCPGVGVRAMCRQRLRPRWVACPPPLRGCLSQGRSAWS
jgi:hypothetical protein